MWSNTKLLVIASLLIIISGFGFLWFGLKPVDLVQTDPVVPSAPVISSPAATSSAAQGIDGEKALVTRVVDGDTIVVNDKTTIRFVGMDTPETVDPRRPVGCFGKEASNETKRLLTGKIIVLQKDISETDKYGRLLRFIYLPLSSGQILFVNDYLIREGFAKAKTYKPDVKFEQQFLEAENQAKENKKGLWGRCN